MIVTCPACATRYLTDVGSFSAHGRMVRCARCGHSWTQKGPESEPPAAPVQQALSSAAVPGVVTAPRPLTPDVIAVPKKASSSIPLFIILVLGVSALLATLYQYRHTIVTAVPETRAAYEQLGIPFGSEPLQFRKVSYRYTNPDDRTGLTIVGEIVNTGTLVEAIPRIRISMHDDAGDPLYARTFAAQQSRLSPDAVHKFSFAVDDPPEGAVDLRVDFFRPARPSGS